MIVLWLFKPYLDSSFNCRGLLLTLVHFGCSATRNFQQEGLWHGYQSLPQDWSMRRVPDMKKRCIVKRWWLDASWFVSVYILIYCFPYFHSFFWFGSTCRWVRGWSSAHLRRPETSVVKRNQCTAWNARSSAQFGTVRHSSDADFDFRSILRLRIWTLSNGTRTLCTGIPWHGDQVGVQLWRWQGAGQKQQSFHGGKYVIDTRFKI